MGKAKVNDLTAAELDQLYEYIVKSAGLSGKALEQLNKEYAPVIDKARAAIAGQDDNPESVPGLVGYYLSFQDLRDKDGNPITGETKPAADNDNLNRIRSRAVNDVNWPIDKPNSSIFNILRENTHGQENFNIKANKDGDPDIDITYSINFDDIESDAPIVKRLTQYDKRVYIAAGALWDAGNAVVTTTQLYHAMGYTGRPNTTDLEKIDNSITKLGARITLDNIQELEAGYNYPKFSYDGPLLLYERVRERDVINGKFIESAIHIAAEPPLLKFARDRKQVTTITIKTLQTPLNKTELNLKIEDYLIERIGRAKNAKKNAKAATKTETILFSTIYKKVNIDGPKDKMKRSRARERIETYLKYYTECNFISGYEINNKGVIVRL